MTRRTALLFPLLLAACGGSSSTGSGDAPAVPPKVAKAAAVASDLEANPDDADAILARHGMTEQEFTDLMYEIAADEELTKALAQARGR